MHLLVLAHNPHPACTLVIGQNAVPCVQRCIHSAIATYELVQQSTTQPTADETMAHRHTCASSTGACRQSEKQNANHLSDEDGGCYDVKHKSALQNIEAGNSGALEDHTCVVFVGGHISHIPPQKQLNGKCTTCSGSSIEPHMNSRLFMRCKLFFCLAVFEQL